MSSQKSKANKSEKKRDGETAFLAHFAGVYAERWPALFTALRGPELQTARRNGFAEPILRESAGRLSFQDLESCYQWSGGELERDAKGLLQYYIMDPASVICARALAVKPGDVVLDMCAAPGGKSLILAEPLIESGELIANEMSAGRRDRLKKVIQQYVSRETRNRVWVTGKEGGLFAKSHPGHFDRVLVDAPCSGERHLLQSPRDLAEWSLNRSQKLAQRQYALLTAALVATKPGGQIVYSTCSISPQENDEVVERLLAKKSGQFVVIKTDGAGEKTRHGEQYFPDVCGFGPIYFSVLQKNI